MGEKTKADHDRIAQLERELGIVDDDELVICDASDHSRTGNAKEYRRSGVPVKRKSTRIKNRDIGIPKVTHARKELDTVVEVRDFTELKVPGDVEHTQVMRLIDARKRKLLNDDIYRSVLEVSEIGLNDQITIVPISKYSDVFGYTIVTEDDNVYKVVRSHEEEQPKTI